jgi:hypothetical protein
MLGQILAKTLVKPFDFLGHCRTFATFSKFHLNTSKSPNIKVVQFFEGHNFAFGWNFKFRVESGEKLGQLQLLLFICVMKTSNSACSLCSNH